MKSNKYQIIKYIFINDMVMIQQIADKFYRSNYDRAYTDVKLMQDDKLIVPHKGTANNIEFFEITIKGKEYLDAFKVNTFRFYLPLIISALSLLISLFTLIK